MPARRSPPLPPRWFEITVLNTNKRRIRKVFDLVAAAGRNPEYQVTVEQIVTEQKTYIRSRNRRYVYGSDAGK